MANFAGARLYPNAGNIPMSPARDNVQVTKVPPTSLPRGGIVEDFNVKLRGNLERIDELPERPYP